MSIRIRAYVPSVQQHTHDVRHGHAAGQSQRWWCSGQSQNKFASSVFASCRCHDLCFIHALLYHIPNK